MTVLTLVALWAVTLLLDVLWYPLSVLGSSGLEYRARLPAESRRLQLQSASRTEHLPPVLGTTPLVPGLL